MAALGAGCASEDSLEVGSIDGETLNADTGSESGTEEITARYAAGTTARTTANLNLRSGAGTGYRIIVVIPNGAAVTLIDGSPSSGWYRTRFNGQEGWTYGQYLTVSSSGGGGTGGGGTGGGGTGGGGSVPTGSATSAQLTRADAGEGFSYWWGNGAWLPGGASSSNRGTCSGSCPSCSHRGTYGADCSGYVAKIWAVPSSNGDITRNSHPYSTRDFAGGTGGGQWRRVDRGAVVRGDALTYNSGGAGHIVWVNSGDGWGSLNVYEARGCAYGIVHNTRSFTSSYVAIRRN